MTQQPFFVAYGAGVNSTAMLIGLQEHGERPDRILFSDTGGEKPETYAFMIRFSRWLELKGLPPIEILHYNSHKDDNLEQECLRLGVLPSIVYGWRTCSQKWKIDPQERFLRKWRAAFDAWAAGDKVVKALGFDFGEVYRADKAHHDDKYNPRFPLIEWQWGRKQCLQAIERAGFCSPPPKSACFFCPSTKKREVIALSKSNPDLFDRAVAMERRAKTSGKNKKIVHLGRHWSWNEIVRLDRTQLKLLPDPPQIPCACRDGWEE